MNWRSCVVYNKANGRFARGPRDSPTFGTKDNAFSRATCSLLAEFRRRVQITSARSLLRRFGHPIVPWVEKIRIPRAEGSELSMGPFRVTQPNPLKG